MNAVSSGRNFSTGNEETHTLSESVRLSFRREQYSLVLGKEPGQTAEDNQELPLDVGQTWNQEIGTLSVSFDLRSPHDLVFQIKSIVEPSTVDPSFADIIVTVRDVSSVKNRVLLFQSLEYLINWNNITRTFSFTSNNHKNMPYFDISGRYVKFCRLDELRSETTGTKGDIDPFQLLGALVKVNLHVKTYSKVVFSSSPEDASEGFQIQFPTTDIFGSNSDDDEDEYEDDIFDETYTNSMSAETMDYYMYFLNPAVPCHSNLSDLRENVQVNCELAEFAKSCGMQDLFQICVNNLERILHSSRPIPKTLQIWNTASKYSVVELEIKAVEAMERYIHFTHSNEREAVQEEIKNFMRQYKLKVCSLTNLLDD